MALTPMKLFLILLIVLVVFGAGKLPKVMGDLGRGLKSFKTAMNGEDTDDTPRTLPVQKGEEVAISEEARKERQG